MKKYFIIAVAALVASAACTKVDTVDTKKEVTFEVAKYLQTKAVSGVKYDENLHFGTYSWFTATDGSTNAEFMVNEEVGLTGGVWKTLNNTFFWPKTGSIDFISYSPFSASSAPAIDQTSITYTDVTIGADDLMYADKVTCSSNVNEVTDDAASGSSDSNYSGVPTLFHHALAKLSFKINASFLSYTDTTTTPANTTSWEVIVKSAKIKGILTEGSLALNWDATNKVWTKPTSLLWTPKSGSATFEQELVPSDITLVEKPAFTNLADFGQAYVMPQELTTGAQQLELKMVINTTLSNGLTITENYEKTLDLSAISTISSWKMNDNIVYTISIKPTATADASNPNMDDPTDVTITFDPAVADWNPVNASVEIKL